MAAEFRLQIDNQFTEKLNKVFKVNWTAKPLDEVTQYIEANPPKQLPVGMNVFHLTDCQKSGTGVLTLKEVCHKLTSLPLRFEFRAPSIEAVYRQKWQISVEIQPCSYSPSVTGEIMNTSNLETIGQCTTNFNFPATLEGQVRDF